MKFQSILYSKIKWNPVIFRSDDEQICILDLLPLSFSHLLIIYANKFDRACKEMAGSCLTDYSNFKIVSNVPIFNS